MLWVGKDLKVQVHPARDRVATSPPGLEYFEKWSIPGIPKIDPKCNLNIDTTLIF